MFALVGDASIDRKITGDATRDGRTIDAILEDPHQLGVTSRKRLADTIDKETG